MYPQGELKLIALRKAQLQRRSALRREVCVEAAAQIVRPLEWFDEARAKWKRLSPLVKLGGLAFGVVARKKFLPRGGLGSWLRWGTAAVSLVRGLRAVRR